MKPLPRSLDDIRGLRAARWIRESTAGQYDRFGPASQREQQDRFIERHGLVDTGLVFQVAHSGTTVWRSPTMNAMIASAQAGDFDLLLAGYSDRWQRNLRRTLELLEDHLHPAGVALVMCDRRILSSDPHDWDELVAEAAAAERYSRRLAERITDGYRAKFEAHGDQAGSAPLGFRRRPEPPHTLEIDPTRSAMRSTSSSATPCGTGRSCGWPPRPASRPSASRRSSATPSTTAGCAGTGERTRSGGRLPGGRTHR